MVFPWWCTSGKHSSPVAGRVGKSWLVFSSFHRAPECTLLLEEQGIADGEAALILNVLSTASGAADGNGTTTTESKKGNGDERGAGGGGGRAACLFGVTMGPRAPCELQDRPVLHR